MNALLRRFIPHSFADHLAFFVAVVVAYATAFFDTPRPSASMTVALIAAGVVYSILGIYGFTFAAGTKSPLALAAYFAAVIPLGTAITYLSRAAGAMWLLLLPLVAHGVMTLPRRWALALSVFVVADFTVVVGLLFEWRAAAQASITYLAGVVFVVVFTQLAVNEQKARAEVERLAVELGEANRRLREYAAQVEELATARERNRLAREIHDSLGHYLTVINVQIDAARVVMDADRPRALDALRKAQTLAQEGLADVRRSVAALRAAPASDRPLPETLAALADECRQAGIVAEFVVRGDPRPLPMQVELTFYRAAQEGLTNVRKHARASRADVALDYRDGAKVRLTVQDNGLGGDAENGGFGLVGVRERAQLLGGTVYVRTAPREGFTLEVEVPG